MYSEVGGAEASHHEVARQFCVSMTVFHLLYSSIQFEIPRSQKLRPKYYEGEF